MWIVFTDFFSWSSLVSQITINLETCIILQTFFSCLQRVSRTTTNWAFRDLRKLCWRLRKCAHFLMLFFLDLQWVSAEIGIIFTDISLWSSMSFLITKKLKVQRFDTKKSETEMCIAVLIFNQLGLQQIESAESWQERIGD